MSVRLTSEERAIAGLIGGGKTALGVRRALSVVATMGVTAALGYIDPARPGGGEHKPGNDGCSP